MSYLDPGIPTTADADRADEAADDAYEAMVQRQLDKEWLAKQPPLHPLDLAGMCRQILMAPWAGKR
jgi:hypothetical protein